MIPHYFDEACADCGPFASRAAKSDSTGQGRNRRAVSRIEIIMLARKTLGTPFRHQGRQPAIGLDCVGLVLWVGNRLSLTRFDILNYPRLPQGDRLRETAKQAGFIPVDNGLPGDVACFCLGRDPQHVGILTDRGLIHACQKVGRVIEHRMDANWRKRIISFFQYPGLV